MVTATLKQSVAKIQTALTICFAKVSPAMARSWLDTSNGNRRIRLPSVEKYTRDMGADRWTLSPDCIAFDVNGYLVAGHHRLLAIIASGTTQLLGVIEGFPLEAVNNIDTGMPRNFGDNLTVGGEVDGRSLAAVVAFMYQWQTTKGQYHQTHRLRMSRPEGFNVFEADSALLREATQRARGWNTNGFAAPPAVIGGLFVVFSRLDADDALEFFERASSGVDLPADSPLLRIRNLLLTEQAKHRRQPRDRVAALTVKAWNAYRKNRQVKMLRWNPAVEAFPTPI